MTKDKLKIAFMIDQLRVGGTENQLLEVIKRIDNNIFQVYLITLRENKFSSQNFTKCKFINLGIESLFDMTTITKCFKYIQFLKDEKIEILQTTFPESTLIGSICGKLAKVDYIITTRREISTWHYLINKIYLRLSNHFADRILVNSESVKKYLALSEKVNLSKIDIIYNGIDSHFFSNGKIKYFKENNKVIIGIISNFNRPVKRFDIFINATKKILLKYKNVAFLVVGKVDDSLLQMIPNDFNKNYIFLGPQSDVRPCLQKMDIGLLCSDSEGFSNVILEYMASGVPCVVTRSGGNIELIEHGINGLLFEQGDFESLVENISILIENPDLRKIFAIESLKKVELNYNWDIIINKVENYYLNFFNFKKN